MQPEFAEFFSPFGHPICFCRAPESGVTFAILQRAAALVKQSKRNGDDRATRLQFRSSERRLLLGHRFVKIEDQTGEGRIGGQLDLVDGGRDRILADGDQLAGGFVILVELHKVIQ